MSVGLKMKKWSKQRKKTRGLLKSRLQEIYMLSESIQYLIEISFEDVPSIIQCDSFNM